MKIKNLVKTLALTAGIAASFSSHADFLDFQVDETPYGGEIVTADKHNGGYKEIISFDDEGNFVANAFANMNQLFANDGRSDLNTNSVSQVGVNYALYATFSAEGNLSGPVVFGQEVKNSASKGSFSLYLDPNRDTSAADGDLSLSGETDDILLGSSSNLGRNTLVFIPKGGVFDFFFYNFELTTNGQEYFVSPQPFYSYVNVDGDFDEFGFTGTQSVTGDVSAAFIPEPSTLAILGLGLLGLGASSRRKAK